MKKRTMKGIILYGLIGGLICVRAGGYIVAYHLGNKDGSITHPGLSLVLSVTYMTLILSILVCLCILLRGRNRFEQLVRNGCLSCITVLVCFVVLEICMIVLEPYIFKGLYQYDSELGFKIRPYANGANCFGFNDRDYSLHKPPGITRVLFVGDSFSWAGGKNGNYTALLEKKFEDHYGAHRVDIINGGYPGTHTGEQLAMVQKYGLKYQPDIIFLGFFVGNDFIDADPYRKRIVVNDTLWDIDTRLEITFLGYPIVARSRLWYFLKQKFLIWRDINTAHAQQNSPSHDVGPESQACTFSPEAFLTIERKRLDFCHLRSHKHGAYDKNIDFIFESLTKLQELSERHQAAFIVGIYPDQFQIDKELQHHLFEILGGEANTYDLELPQRLLSEFLTSEHIPYIDLLGTFQDAGTQQTLYLCRNTHWNQAGNELAAHEIFQYLRPYVDSLVAEKQ